jgi:hypothetical protein
MCALENIKSNKEIEWDFFIVSFVANALMLR